jgi:uncharacterized membrane protein HdeD (DUF308 family)
MSFGGLVTVFLETLMASFLIFLVGFFASVAVGAPLFIALEKRKRRNMWPYLAAAIGVAIASFLFANGGLPGPGAGDLVTVVSIFVPAIVIALTFARLMKPHWRAAERADARSAGPIMVRLH